MEGMRGITPRYEEYSFSVREVIFTRTYVAVLDCDEGMSMEYQVATEVKHDRGEDD